MSSWHPVAYGIYCLLHARDHFQQHDFRDATTRRYEVAKKRTKFDDAVGEMAERIARCFCSHGRVQCGIVYCLSRNDCEKVAAELQVGRCHAVHACMQGSLMCQ